MAPLLAAQTTPARADCNRGSSLADVIFGVLDAASKSGSSSTSTTTSGGTAASAGECVVGLDGELACHEREEPEDKTPIHVEFATVVRSFASPLRQAASGSLDHDGESFGYRMVEPEAAAQNTAIAGQLRVLAGLPLGLYAGGEGEFGVVPDSRAAAEITNDGFRMPDVERSYVSEFGGAAILGIGARLGPVTGAVETAGGFQAVSYHVRSFYGACITGSSITRAAPILEGRARAAVWVTPHIAVGATYGTSLIDDAWLAGAYIDVSSRRFGGR